MRGLSPVSVWRVRVAVTAGFLVLVLLLLRGFYRRELYHFTGAAAWMWTTDDVRENRPIAGLFVHGVELHDRPQRALAKVCGDQQYVLWINGQPAMAGRNRPHFHLDVVPVTDLLTSGVNVIAIEARSSTSVGAVLFALDLYPTAEGRRAGDPRGRNVVVSGQNWRVLTTWKRGPGTVKPGVGARPWVWGRPPDHPWSYPTPVVHERPIVQAVIGEPVHLRPGDYRQRQDGLWVHPLPQGWEGYLWVGLQPGDARDVKIGVQPEGAAAERPVPDMVPLVHLPDQRTWLFPGFVRGDAVVVESERPPTGVTLVEAKE